MLAAIVKSVNDLQVMQVPEPEVGDYHALVEIICCATCNSTDLRLLEGTMSWQPPFPFILGHESVGRVIKSGKKVKNFQEGDVVLRPTAVYPGDKLGQFYSALGGYAQLGLVTDVEALMEEEHIPASQINSYAFLHQKVPADFDPIDASMLINLRETLSWTEQLGVREGSKVLIIGDGPVGLSFLKFAKLKGAKPVILSGHRKERLRLAERLGADYAVDAWQIDAVEETKKIVGELDFIIDAVGALEAVKASQKLLAPEGKIALYGVPKDASLEAELYQPKIARIATDEPGAHHKVIELVRQKAVDPKDFYCDVLPIEKIASGFQRIKQKQALTKLVITM